MVPEHGALKLRVLAQTAHSRANRQKLSKITQLGSLHLPADQQACAINQKAPEMLKAAFSGEYVLVILVQKAFRHLTVCYYERISRAACAVQNRSRCHQN